MFKENTLIDSNGSNKFLLQMYEGFTHEDDKNTHARECMQISSSFYSQNLTLLSKCPQISITFPNFNPNVNKTLFESH